jgi:hypothetical protein
VVQIINMPQPVDDESKQSSKQARRDACSPRRASRNLDDTLLCDLKDALVKKNKKRRGDGSSQQKYDARHDNLGVNDVDNDSVEVLERFPSPHNGKLVSDVEYNPDFLVVRQGQLTSSRLSASKKDDFARTGMKAAAAAATAHSEASVARGTSNTASQASLPTTKSSTQARSREHRLRRRNQVTDLEYHVDFGDIQDARLFPKAGADSIVGGDADFEENIQPVPAAVCGPEQAESLVAEVPVRKTSVATRSQQGRGRPRSNFVLEVFSESRLDGEVGERNVRAPTARLTIHHPADACDPTKQCHYHRETKTMRMVSDTFELEQTTRHPYQLEI